MNAQLRLTATALALAVGVAPASAQERERPADEGPTVRILGTVIDQSTQEPVPSAEIVLRPEDGGDLSRRSADGDGQFGFPIIPVGSYAIEIEALGYHAINQSLPIREVAELRITAELVPLALELDPVVVVTERRGSMDRTGFNERLRTGFGRYITREDIEARNPFYVSDLLRTVPGVRVVPDSRGFGNAVLLRRGCRPTIYLDGMRLAMLDGFGIDDLLMAHDVEGIEVYQGIQAPAQFSGGSCGAVVLWTRRGEQGAGQGSNWKRVAIGLGVMGLGFLLTR